MARGETHGRRKLTDAEVIEIRRRRDAGEKGAVIARDFGVTNGLVCQIFKRKIWKHLA